MDYIGWIIGIVGGVIGIVGIVIAIILNKRKRLSVYKESNVLIHNSETPHEKLKITFDNQIIPNMTTTLITIWCSGNDKIQNSDVRDDCLWKIVTSDESEILEAKILKATAHDVDVQKNAAHEAVVTFDSFDVGEGVAFQVVHTGSVSDICFIYRILGNKNSQKTYQPHFQPTENKRKLAGAVAVAGVVAGAGVVAAVAAAAAVAERVAVEVAVVADAVAAAVVVAVEVAVLSPTPLSKIPKELRKYATFRK